MEENQPDNSVEQPTMKQLPEDPLRNIFHRLPSDPSALAFISVVYKAWRRIVHDEDNFLRPFRAAHSNTPPLLGLFSDASYGQLQFTPSTNSGVVNLPAPPTLLHAYGCTHGRLLLHDDEREGLLVWDPLTGDKHLIRSPPPGFLPDLSCGAALVCDADHANHGDCHSSPFRVVFAYSEHLPPGGWHPPMAPVHTFVCVYSSETGSWGDRPVATICVGNYFDYKPSAVAGNGAAVFWMTEEESTVLEFHLETQTLILRETPLVVRDEGFVLAPTMDAGLGLAGVMGGFVVLFTWEDGAWADRDVVMLDDLLPFHAHDEEYEDGGDGLLRFQIEYFDDEEYEEDGGDGLLRFQIGHSDEEEYQDSDELDAPMRPRVVGFSEELNSVFLQAEPPGVFIINLASGKHQRVLEMDHQHLSFVYPYCSFYTAAGKAILNDVQVDQEKNNIQSGGEISMIEEKSSGDDADKSFQ